VGVRVAEVESPLSEAIWYRAGHATFEVGRCAGTASRAGDWVVAVYGARGCERVARFDDALCDVDLVVDPVALAGLYHPLQDPIDEILLIHQLANSGGALLEGALSRGDAGGAVLTVRGLDGDGPGPSGPGTSERVVVRLGQADDEVWLHTTPWSKRSLGPDTACAPIRLEAVRVLEGSSQPFRERLHPDAGACELLAHASAPLHFAEGAESAASTIRRVAARVPVTRIGEPRCARVIPVRWGQPQASLGFARPA